MLDALPPSMRLAAVLFVIILIGASLLALFWFIDERMFDKEMADIRTRVTKRTLDELKEKRLATARELDRVDRLLEVTSFAVAGVLVTAAYVVYRRVTK